MNPIVNIQSAIEKATVRIDMETGLSTVKYVLTGEAGAVRSAVGRLERDYNPVGYGTTVRYTETGAIVTRAKSCD